MREKERERRKTIHAGDHRRRIITLLREHPTHLPASRTTDHRPKPLARQTSDQGEQVSSHQPNRWSGKRTVTAGKPSSREKAVVAEPLPAVPDEQEATDAAKALAAEHNIDLDAVTGTGQDGRITKDDVAALVPAEEPSLLDESADQPAEQPAAD